VDDVKQPRVNFRQGRRVLRLVQLEQGGYDATVLGEDGQELKRFDSVAGHLAYALALRERVTELVIEGPDDVTFSRDEVVMHDVQASISALDLDELAGLAARVPGVDLALVDRARKAVEVAGAAQAFRQLLLKRPRSSTERRVLRLLPLERGGYDAVVLDADGCELKRLGAVPGYLAYRLALSEQATEIVVDDARHLAAEISHLSGDGAAPWSGDTGDAQGTGTLEGGS
jgi:hypothetical protein